MSDTDMLEQKDANEFIKNVLDRLDIHCQQIQSEGIRFKKIFVGTFRGMITCQKCKNSSVTTETFTDLIISTQNDFWAGMSYILWPQPLEGYFCNQCQSKQNAQKRVNIQNIPELLQITLQRFSYDQYGYLHKDDNIIRMPLFIDLFILNNIDIYDYCQFKKMQQFTTLIQVILQPWKYIKFEEGLIVIDPQLAKTVKQAFQQLLNIDSVKVYLHTYYFDIQLADPFSLISCDVQHSFSTNNDSLFMTTMNSSEFDNSEEYPLFPDQKIPPEYYQLSAITCHSGSLNQGHYYNLCIKQMVNNPQKFVMFNCNDTYVHAINNPHNTLSRISGKLDTSVLANPNNANIEKSNSRPSQSNTGYMYFYEKLCNKQHNEVVNIKQICQSTHLIKKIQQENAEIEKEIYTINIRLYSNFNESTQQCDIFGTQTFTEFDFDLRGTTAQLVQEFYKNTKSIDNKVKKALSKYNICIHKCEQNTNNRIQLIADQIDDNTSLEQCLFSQFNNLNYTKNFKKQHGKDQKKQITLFIEIITNTHNRFEYQYIYVYLNKVQLEQTSEIYCDNVVGYQKYIKVLTKYICKIDKQKLIDQFYKSNYYNKQLCSSDQQRTQISVDSRQLLCELILLKLAICNIDTTVSLDKMLVYKKDMLQQQIQLCNNVSGKLQSDMATLLQLQNQDEIFYESIGIKLGNQILYQQPKRSDFQKLKSSIFQTIESEQILMLRLYNSQCNVIKQQPINERWEKSMLIKQTTDFIKKNVLSNQQEGIKQESNEYKIYFYILIKNKEGFKTFELPENDMDVKSLLEYVCVQNKLQVQPQNLNVIFFLNEKEYEQFNQQKKPAGNVKRSNAQDKPVSNLINIKVTNQHLGSAIQLEVNPKMTIAEMFQQMESVFNYQKELLKTNPKGRLKPDLIFTEALLRYNSNMTVRQFIEIYFQIKYKVFSFIVQKKATIQQSMLKIILQKPENELQLVITKNKFDKQCIIHKGKNWGELIQSLYKNINFANYKFFVFTSENSYIFFDYNEIREPLQTEIALDFTGTYYLFIDEKSNLIKKYEEYYQQQYENEHYYYYATIYYEGEYGRIRIFKRQTVKDLQIFMQNVFGQKINVYIISNKRHLLKETQNLIEKIEYGLFICA